MVCFFLPPPLNGPFRGQPILAAEVGQLVERAAAPAAPLDGPRRPLPHVPQHPDRLELPVGGAVGSVLRRRVDEPKPVVTPRGEDAVPGVTGGGLEDGGEERASVVWNG